MPVTVSSPQKRTDLMSESRGKPKVLFFDVWAYGKKYLDPLFTELNTQGFEVVFASNDERIGASLGAAGKTTLSKWKEKRVGCGDDDCLSADIDLSNYDGSFLKMFQAVRPDVLVVISLHGLEQRHACFVANELAIPTAMIMHGIRGDSATTNTANASLVETCLKILSRWRRITYYLKCFRHYMHDRVRLRGSTELARRSNLRDLASLLISHKKYMLRPGSSDQINYDLLSVTHAKDVGYYQRNYGVGSLSKNTKFIVHGSLDLGQLLTEEAKSFAIRFDEKKVLFISQPVVSQGLVSKADFVQVISSLAAVCCTRGLQLVIRPHPRDDLELLNELASKFHLAISEDTLNEDIWTAGIVVGLNSSLLYSASLLGKSVIIFAIPSYPPLEAIQDLAVIDFTADEEKLERDTLKLVSSLILSSPSLPLQIQAPEKLLLQAIAELCG